VPDDAVTTSGDNLKDQVGWSMVACILANLILNIAIILKEVIQQTIDKCKNRRTKTLRIKHGKLIE
jgi:hypothetical protein